MNLPQYRSHDYAIWRACERFAVHPPGIKKSWDDIVPWFQAMLIAYDQIRGCEEAELASLMALRGIQ